MAGFNTAVTGLKAATTDLDVTGNNIANASTVGFKSSRTEFGDIYATAVVGAGSSNVAGAGVTVTDIAQDFQAGTVEFTNNNLDLAINGSGFFQLDDGQGGTTYTRAGAFELDKDGFMVSKTGKYLQGYGLDEEGNRLPIGNLAVTEKESPPKATEEIDLSFNIDSREDSTTLLSDYDKDEPGSFTYSTTVRTFDSLGNEHTVKINMAEARPVQAQQQITSLTAGDTISGVTVTAAHMTELAGYAAGDVISSGAFFSDLTDPVTGDARIGSVVINAAGDITLRFKSEYPEPDLVQVTGSSAVAEIEEIDANETYTFAIDSGEVPLTAAVVLEVGGISIGTLGIGSTADQIGQAITASEAKILDANPSVESVIYDNVNQEVVVTYKAESGDITPAEAITITETSGAVAGAPFDAAVVKNGDNSFEGVYRMYAYLNGSEQLDIGKELDPGETGTGTEPGPILVKFNPSNGLLTGINGDQFSAGSVVPTITITGADPADSTTVIDLDIANTTQFASSSIVKASTQDGYTKGDLIGVTFAGTGEMVASFSNGQTQDLGVVAIATFENQSGLSPSGDTEWTSTLASGDAIVNPPGTGLNGTLQSAALEQSNVDLSAELVSLIEAQRNFQANSKTLETLNTVTQNILQI
ncbi:flagellar hook protein FlgE [Neptuniibacter sp. 2_MG-2023]|jgi:flagellar hook protein FlgE|uniref:flagellar hook protein FlgE n=1 Tax=Neptuniibacter sp. 2_MG-2023 TaxID=3062671 RepID=UPI0026E21CBB|nr:flagellar hook-basal body complex protein [Neptuniibacter sp. 2_MG-2023]MDO6515444.1 flagellar hook-basal body complex protein [Neptuniibacter sp. 2_MG-2023]